MSLPDIGNDDRLANVLARHWNDNRLANVLARHWNDDRLARFLLDQLAILWTKHWNYLAWDIVVMVSSFARARPRLLWRAFEANTIFCILRYNGGGAQRSQLLPPLFLSPTIKSNVAVIIQHKSGRAANITNHTSMKQSKQLVPKFILTRQGISVQIGPYLSHKAVWTWRMLR